MVTEETLEKVKDECGEVFESHGLNPHEMISVMEEMIEDLKDIDRGKRINRILRNVDKGE